MPAIYGKAGGPGDVHTAELLAMSRAVTGRNAEPGTFSNGHGVALGYCATGKANGAAAAQPFVDGAIVCAFDGQIYNSVSLAATAEAATPQQDAGILVRLYQEFGPGFVEKLRGSFAIALWDGTKNELVLARDHLGHRPLFFAQTDRGFYFASEAKCLMAGGIVPFELDLEALSHFLSFRFLPAPHYLVRGIRKLGPANVLSYCNDRVTVRQYWAPCFRNKLDLEPEQLIEGLSEKLSETISTQVDNAGEVGVLLSGGLDSGLIVAKMANTLSKPFHTLSLGVRDSTDEVPLAGLVAGMYNTRHQVSYVEADAIRMLPAMVACLDEPTDMVIISKYIGAMLAAPHVGTLMSGDGGDELFAGFPRYLGVSSARHLQLLPTVVRDRIFRPIAEYAGGHAAMESLPGKVLWMLEMAGAGGLPQRYAEASSYLRYRASEKTLLLTDEVNAKIADVDSVQLLADIVQQADADHPIEKLLYVDYFTRLPEHLLMLDDRTGRMSGLDVRFPFADRELVEYAAAIPAALKIKGRQAKGIERKIAANLLPAEIVRNRKTGLRLPFSALFAGELNPFLRSMFRESRLIEDRVLRQDFVERMLSEHQLRTHDHHVRLWMLATLEIWYRLNGCQQSCEEVTGWFDQLLQATA